MGLTGVSALLRAAARTLNYETWNAQNIFRGTSGDIGVTVELAHSRERVTSIDTPVMGVRWLCDAIGDHGSPNRLGHLGIII